MVEESYISIYNKHRELLQTTSAAPLDAIRDEAFDVFCRMGFPTDEQERYKRSNISDVFATEYGMNIRRIDIASTTAPYRCDVPGLKTHNFYVVNDIFAEAIAKEEIAELAKYGVIAGSLSTVAKEHPEIISKYYGKIAPHSSDVMVAFNTAFAQDGFVLYVPKNVQIERPIQLINMMHADFDLLATSRNLIILEENASAKVIICNHSESGHKFLANRVTEVSLAENSNYSHYEISDSERQTTNIGSLYVEQTKSSVANINNITLRTGYTRNNIRINLSGEYAETTLCGIVIGDEHDHIDNDTYINHKVSHCKSTELFKYVMDDCSYGSFAGRILVEKNAQKTEAYQSNKNICAKTTAKMFSKPQLEIYADDVKCSHGATVGQIEDEALFYLRTRGISEKEARMLLLLAFTNDIVEKIDIEALRNRIKVLIEKRFRRETHKCTTCNSCHN